MVGSDFNTFYLAPKNLQDENPDHKSSFEIP